jgi:CRP-like cAMP-binding protein
MKANRAYRLIVSRAGREPAFMAERNRLDRIEVVSVADEEIVLYWNLPVKQASRLLKQLRRDLVGLEADAFITRWEGADGTEDWPL